MFRTFRSWLCLLQIWLLIGATPLWAGVCTQIYSLERKEARIAILIEGLNPTVAAPAVTQALNRIFDRARILKDTTLRSQDLAQVTSEYLASVNRIRHQRNFRTPVGTAELFASPQHRRLLRRMVAISHDSCGFERNATPPSHDASSRGSHGFSNLPDISAPFALSAMTILLAGLAVGGYFAIQLANLRKKRRRRYLCNYNVILNRDHAPNLTMQMVDVSGMGAKLRLEVGQKISGTVKVQIGRRTIKARVVWKNDHFAGLLFQKPLSHKFVRKISKGLAERTGRSRADRNRSPTPSG